MTEAEFDDEPNTGLRRALIASIGGISILFLSAFLAGYAVAMLEYGMPTLTDAAIVGAMLAVIAAVIAGCVKLWPNTGPEPIGPSVKRSRDLMYLTIGLSVVAGIALAVAEGPDNNILFSNGPISSTTGLFVLIGWLIVVPIVTLLWWRSIDEHEASTYRDSSMVAAHAYMFIVPAWWLAARAGWVPHQDPMIVFLIFCAIWCVAWFYRKFA